MLININTTAAQVAKQFGPELNMGILSERDGMAALLWLGSHAYSNTDHAAPEFSKIRDAIRADREYMKHLRELDAAENAARAARRA
jgi:hypothetical protein